MKISTFDVRSWESDEKSVFGQNLSPKVCKDVDFFFQKLGLNFQDVKISTFDGSDDVQSWEVMKKVFLDKVGAPKCGRSGHFFKS